MLICKIKQWKRVERIGMLRARYGIGNPDKCDKIWQMWQCDHSLNIYHSYNNCVDVLGSIQSKGPFIQYSYIKIQGVPRNKTVNSVFIYKDTGCSTKQDSSKTTWKSSFGDIKLSTYFNMYHSWNNNHKTLIALAFTKCGLPLVCCQCYRRYEEFHSDLKFI